MATKYTNPNYHRYYAWNITDLRHAALVTLVQNQLKADAQKEFLTAADLPTYRALAPEFGALAVLAYYLEICGVRAGE